LFPYQGKVNGMKFLYFRSTWGMETTSLGESLRQIRAGGFDGVELGVPPASGDCAEIRSQCQDLGLRIVVQQWTAGANALEHESSFEEQYRRAILLDPIRINSHTGKDFFSLKQNLAIFDHATFLERAEGVPVLHETHRGRALFSATSTQAILSKRPEVRLTADFSHWCCVHESLLEDQPEALSAAAKRSFYIHARVGFSQGPQIPDPRAPEWADTLATHLGWWKEIAAIRAAEGLSELHICPEFGPAPYMTLLPHSRKPIADLWEVNCFMRNWLSQNLCSAPGPST
jgi:hypothetical protein